MSDNIQKCQGFEDLKLCDDCANRTQFVEFQKAMFYPPANMIDGTCKFKVELKK